MDSFVDAGGHFNNSLIEWGQHVSYVVDLSRVTKRRARSLIFSSLAQPLLPQ